MGKRPFELLDTICNHLLQIAPFGKCPASLAAWCFNLQPRWFHPNLSSSRAYAQQNSVSEASNWSNVAIRTSRKLGGEADYYQMVRKFEIFQHFVPE